MLILFSIRIAKESFKFLRYREDKPTGQPPTYTCFVILADGTTDISTLPFDRTFNNNNNGLLE